MNPEFAAAAAALDAPASPSPDPDGIDERRVWDALSTVIDPEIGLDIVTLGLVYDLQRDGGTMRVTYTLTTPGCPMERVITQGIREALGLVEGVTAVDTHLVWDPEWHSGMIAPGAWATAACPNVATSAARR